MKKFRKKILIKIILGFIIASAFVFPASYYTYWLIPQKVAHNEFNIENFMPVSSFFNNSHLFVFGNQEQNQNNQIVVFAIAPEPTFKKLITSTNAVLKNVTNADSLFILTGWTDSAGFKSGWAGLTDNYANLLWDTVFSYDYSNYFCCSTLKDSVIIIAGALIDQDGSANLQLMRLSLDGHILGGKTYVIGYTFFPVKLLVSGQDILIAGNTNTPEAKPVIVSIDSTLQLSKISYLPADSLMQIYDIISADDNYLIAGTKDNQTKILLTDSNFNIIWSKTLPSQCQHGMPQSVTTFRDNFIVSLICFDRNSVFYKLTAIDQDGFLQWSYDYQPGYVNLLTSNRYITTISSNGEKLTLEKYRRKNPAIWTKVFTANSTGANPSGAYFTGNYLLTLSGNDSTADLALIYPDKRLFARNSVNFPGKIKSTAVFRGKFYVLSASESTQTNWLSVMGINSQNKIIFSNFRVNCNALASDFKLLKNGYILTGINTKDSSLWTGFFDLRHELLWQQSFETGKITTRPHVAVLGNNYVSIANTRETDSTTSFIAVCYAHDGMLQWAKNYYVPQRGAVLKKAVSYGNYLYIATQTSQFSIITKIDSEGNIIWQQNLPVTGLSDMIIYRNNLVIASGTQSNIILTYLNTSGNILKTVQYNYADGTHTFLAKTKYLYIYSRTLIGGKYSNIVIKTR